MRGKQTYWGYEETLQKGFDQREATKAPVHPWTALDGESEANQPMTTRKRGSHDRSFFHLNCFHRSLPVIDLSGDFLG